MQIPVHFIWKILSLLSFLSLLLAVLSLFFHCALTVRLTVHFNNFVVVFHCYDKAIRHTFNVKFAVPF